MWNNPYCKFGLFPVFPLPRFRKTGLIRLQYIINNLKYDYNTEEYHQSITINLPFHSTFYSFVTTKPNLPKYSVLCP